MYRLCNKNLRKIILKFVLASLKSQNLIHSDNKKMKKRVHNRNVWLEMQDVYTCTYNTVNSEDVAVMLLRCEVASDVSEHAQFVSVLTCTEYVVDVMLAHYLLQTDRQTDKPVVDVARDAQCCVHTRRSHTQTSSSKAAVSSASDIPQSTRIRNSAFRISAFHKIHLPAVSRCSIFIDCGKIQRGLLDQSALESIMYAMTS